MNCKRRNYSALFAAAMLSGMLCQNVSAENAEDDSALIALEAEEMFTDRDKEIGYDEQFAVHIHAEDGTIVCDSDTVEVTDQGVRILTEGVYIISGTLSDGQIVVEAEETDKIQLVLDGAEINCNTSAAIYMKSADKVFLTLASGSENKLSNEGEFQADGDTNVDAVIFSKADLTINGNGTLKVDSAGGHGIVSKDDLVLTGGTCRIISSGHALSGKDSVRIADGNLTLRSGKDGIHADNSDDSTLGFIYISGGTIAVSSEGDGMDASGILQIDGGTIEIEAGGGSEKKEEEQESTSSMKGMKGTGGFLITGGSVMIDSFDDSLHSNGSGTVTGGELTLSSGDDGIHADSDLNIDGGTVVVETSYEGLEGQTVTITGGAIDVTASDDGINAAGGNDQSGLGWGMRQDVFAADEDCRIEISGGTIYVDASGDGIDSNGNLYVSGGETYVSGPTDNGDGALDYNGEAMITGGIFVAVGAGGMAQNFGYDSTQGAMLVMLDSSVSDAEVALKDTSGSILLSYQGGKSFDSVLVSCPEIREGESYVLEAGGQSVDVEMTDLIYGTGGIGHMGGMRGDRGNGRFGGMEGNGEEQWEKPEGESMEFPGGKEGERMEPPEGMNGEKMEPPEGMNGEKMEAPEGMNGEQMEAPEGMNGEQMEVPEGTDGGGMEPTEG